MHYRVIPTLLYKNDGLYKGHRFKNHVYLGDPQNAIRIFSEKEVDELVLFDINATLEQKKPNIQFINRVAEECYMPFAIGGGINNLDTIRDVLRAGAEKVILNTKAVSDPQFIKFASEEYGRTSIVVALDYRKNFFGKNIVYTYSGTRKTRYELIDFVRIAEDMGAGELILTSIDRDGTRSGIDLETIKKVKDTLSIPIIASGGVGNSVHIEEAVKFADVSAVAVGTYFVLKGNHNSVLITYPKDWK
ncbi:HisA/HisF-related TIM barrel protein [Spirosoma panaciterrae]|uniref:HisA/HisF-related TIM barrel protein n=1 Tax=Spirosoma panaciterrae TaxID=496058 RepID=UPI00036822D9|nr:HisA/HisF-related TIM barrel protein [Spirosoma panaciterrae]